ncbi:MAG: serine hydroxymethyltransferase [Candidatus Buchananbacteria bacterium]
MGYQEIFDLINKEADRQRNGLVMIASENYASENVLKAMGSPLSNKYSEGYPAKRYYTGNQFVDEIENMAKSNALKMFELSEEEWSANVQPHSGSSANLACYLGLLTPGDKIMGMNLSQGGHLTHGSPVNFSGKLFNFIHYGVKEETGRIDYDEVERIALAEQPKMIVCGATAYPRTIDFERFKAIADKVGAILLADICHIIGLIIAGVHPSPFPHADIVTSTTHKTLSGPRSALIISKKQYSIQIDKAIFPGLQGGPLDNMTAAKAICFWEATTEAFKQKQKQTILNTQTLAETLKNNGLKIISDGTDNHLLLVDCRSVSLMGKECANLLAEAEIYTNFNTIPYDPSTPFNPSGIRIGTPALTTRGMKEEEMKIIGNWISQILKNPVDQSTREKIKIEVKALTDKFPIYANYRV